MGALHMLDVMIGVIFVFLLVSLICTALSEMIEAMFKKRAADLAMGIKQLFQDPKGTGLTKDFYDHPLVKGLYKKNYKPGKTGNLPSYIPARNFALAVYDIISNAGASHSIGSPPVGSPPAAGTLSSVIGTDLDPVKKAFDAIGIASHFDIEKTIKGIEEWYNSTMDRVSGWYKRRVQVILFGLGLIVAGSYNIDTIAIFKSLNNDPALRNALVSASQEYVKLPGNDTASARARVEKNVKQLRELGLPIGWDWVKPTSTGPNYVTNYNLAYPWSGVKDPEKTFMVILKILGIIITALAVSLGASFWFDLLNKIMVIRSTVKPKEKSPDEPSVDR